MLWSLYVAGSKDVNRSINIKLEADLWVSLTPYHGVQS